MHSFLCVVHKVVSLLVFRSFYLYFVLENIVRDRASTGSSFVLPPPFSPFHFSMGCGWSLPTSGTCAGHAPRDGLLHLRVGGENEDSPESRIMNRSAFAHIFETTSGAIDVVKGGEE